MGGGKSLVAHGRKEPGNFWGLRFKLLTSGSSARVLQSDCRMKALRASALFKGSVYLKKYGIKNIPICIAKVCPGQGGRTSSKKNSTFHS